MRACNWHIANVVNKMLQLYVHIDADTHMYSACATLTTARQSLCTLVSAFIIFLLHAVHSLSEDTWHSAAAMLKMQLRATRIFHIFSLHLS